MTRMVFDREALPPGRYYWREVQRGEMTAFGTGESAKQAIKRALAAGASFFLSARNAMVPIWRDEDIVIFAWDWRESEPNWGEGRYVFRDGDWVRP